ncbi:MAG: hypothetical protein AAFQ65_09390 [Myxococcota bacterium]
MQSILFEKESDRSRDTDCGDGRLHARIRTLVEPDRPSNRCVTITGLSLALIGPALACGSAVQIEGQKNIEVGATKSLSRSDTKVQDVMDYVHSNLRTDERIVPNRNLEVCLVNRIRRWVFPRHDRIEGIDVDYPIAFRSAETL